MIAFLPDPLALHLLISIVRPRLRASTADIPPTADLLAALADTFGPAPAAPALTPGDLARAALAVAIEDPKMQAALDAFVNHGTPPTYGGVEVIAVVTAALAMLQTEVSFEKTPAGKWKLELHKRAASDARLTALAHALTRALGSEARLPK
jgi:hypothetical protein